MNGGSLLGEPMAYRPTERTEARRAQTRATDRARRAARSSRTAATARRRSAAVAERAGVATGHGLPALPLQGRAARPRSSGSPPSTRSTPSPSAAAARHARAERIAAAVETFARRALQGRRLAWALLAEPVDPAVEAERLQFRRAYADAFAATIADGVARRRAATTRTPPSPPPRSSARSARRSSGRSPPPTPTPTPDALVANLITFCLRSTTDQELSEDVHRRAA